MFGTLAGRLHRLVQPEILEIRVHGVRNTRPAEMLETWPDNVRPHGGDELGSFWRRRDAKPAGGVADTEAYSWGAQARTGGGALAAISRALVQIGWLLLLPYALANLAYWTRPIDPQKSAGKLTWHGDSGAATVRVFALLLTLITATAFCSVAIDLIAVQCFRGGEQVCAALPEFFDRLVGLDRDSRAALLGLVPIAAIVILYVIGRRGRVTAEESANQLSRGLRRTDTNGDRPLLATGRFWSMGRSSQTTERLHVAASITLVLLVLALDAAYVNNDECFNNGFFSISSECVVAGFENGAAAGFTLGAFALLVVTIVLVIISSHTRSEKSAARKRGAAMSCLILSIIGYTAWSIVVLPVAETPPEGRGVTGLILMPIALVVIGLFLALAGISWRSSSKPRRVISAVFLVLGAASLLISLTSNEDVSAARDARWLGVVFAGVFVALHLLTAWTTPDKYRYRAWRGQGAAVVMILALFASMTLSSLLVIGFATWLGEPAGEAPTDGIYRTPVPIPSAQGLDTPDAYERFAVVLTMIAILMLLVIVFAVLATSVRFVRFTLPVLSLRPGEASKERTSFALGGIRDFDPETYEPPVRYPKGERRRRLIVRRGAHLLHRGEPLIGWLAVLVTTGFFSLSAQVVFDTLRANAAAISPDLPSVIRVAANTVLAAVAVGAVAAVAAHAASSSERPLAVFWDIVAFFPRAGHPFAPPCYGERVVPELAARTIDWMEDKRATRPRAVIFTAHSMGSTICAATLLAMRGQRICAGPMSGDHVVDHMALLSYGTQLRAYFSRFFPSVFGPEVLGIPRTLGPSLWTADPWKKQVLEDMKGLPKPAQGDQIALTTILGAHGREVPRWRNLWRRTDFLGFPVYGYNSVNNPVDRGATEMAPGYVERIATHGDYLGTPQFQLARASLVQALGGKPR